MKRTTLLLVALASFGFVGCEEKQEPAKPASKVKRVVRLSPLETKFIELDDGSKYGMGENLYNRLVTRLQESGNFVVVVNEDWDRVGISSSKSTLKSAPAQEEEPKFDPSDRIHFDFAPVPAAEFTASVDSLTFSHGSRGVKRFAGYSPEFTSPFNNGSLLNTNEFTPRSIDFVNGWFGTTFDPIGEEPKSTISGVNTGEEGEFSLVLANVHYRRDSYFASAHVNTNIRLLAENKDQKRLLDASGTGFLFALGVGYKELSVEFGITRRTALKETFDRAVEKMAEEIRTQLFAIPFRTKVEKVTKEGIFINAGRREGVKVGDVFFHNAGGKISKLKVMEAFLIGSRVESDFSAADLKNGDVIVLEENAAPSNSAANTKSLTVKSAASSTTADVPDNRAVANPNPTPSYSVSKIVLDPPEFHDPDGNVSNAINAKKFMLAYLLWRWTQYDQDIQNLTLAPKGDIFTAAQARWNLNMIRVREAWARGLQGEGVTVAILDSGVDYNHKNLARALPRTYSGFDFMSHDLRPFDDNSHGTSIAGIIAAQAVERNQVGVAPGAKLLSYKVFDPYGQTTSAAIYAAFDRAIKEGAKIIVCAWDTRKNSVALAEAIRLAEEKGVLVITAAGDQGENIRETPHYPAAYNKLSNVISVAGLNSAGGLTQVSGRFSNFGLEAVDIAAPGAELEVLAPRSEYLTRTGTDLAAAHVAGVAALVWQKHPNASAKEIKDRILSSAQKNAALSGQISEGRVLDAAAATE